ncbi:hypothetical protein ACFLRO_02515, partial [Bacteroidota bacterium]
IARVYETLGNTEKMMESIRIAEPMVLDRFAEATNERDIQRLQQFIQMVQVSYFKAGDFESASRFSQDLAQVAGDSSLAQTTEELEQLYGQFAQPRIAPTQQSDRESGPEDSTVVGD